MSASKALDHDFMKLAEHRGLGQKLNVDSLKAYCNRRKWQVSKNTILSLLYN